MTTTWKPDTCDCIVEYDDNINLTTVIQRCSFHQALASNADVFNTLKDENPKKNIAIHDLLLNNAPTSVFDIDTETGNRKFKAGVNVAWTWSGTAPNRVLTITVTGITLTTQQKNTVRTFLDNRFGAGKVILA